MKAVNSKEIPEKIFLNHPRLLDHLTETGNQFAIYKNKKYTHVYGKLNDLRHLCQATDGLGTNFRFTNTIYDGDTIGHVLATKDISIEEVIAIIEAVA